jgi:DNA-binding transcriptional regulator LsrR (DeoR family)
MMREDNDILRLVEIARLYYEKQLTQAQIAKRLNVSRPAVSKLLSEARNRGIVKIEIKSPLESMEDLLSQLIEGFGLRGGLIVPAGSADETLRDRFLISQAAIYVERLLPTFKKIGLGWGYSVGSLIDELKQHNPRESWNGLVCPVVGSAPNDIRWFQSNELTRIFAEKTGYTPFYLHAPAFPTSVSNKELFEKTLEYQEVSKLWAELDAVFLGVGTYPSVPDQATAARFGNKLREKKAVGMIATFYFDRDGNIIESENDIVVRIPLENLRRAKRVFAIGGGEKKRDSVAGALGTGLATHLITDEATAREIIERYR